MAHSHKTKQAALKAARKDLGERAIEGVDFTLRNTGAGWIAIKIPAANQAAADAQTRRKAPKAAKADPKVAPEPRVITSPNRSAGAKSGHTKRQAAPEKAPAGETKTDLIVAMISTRQGATSKQLEAATGWAPHSVRGLLGMLRKRGVHVESCKVKGQPTVYRITKAKRPAPPQDVGDVL